MQSSMHVVYPRSPHDILWHTGMPDQDLLDGQKARAAFELMHMPPKKGEKRSAECRCDELGRFCCLLESEHWDALLSLQKPRVDFDPNREVLMARHSLSPTSSLPATPAYSVGTPQMIHSVPSTPGPLSNGVQPTLPGGTPEGPYMGETQSPRPVPRFGMMGVGTPWGDTGFHGQDVLVWEGQAPTAPREYHPYTDYQQPESLPAPSSIQAPTPHVPPNPYANPPPRNHDYHPPAQSLGAMTVASQEPLASEFDFDKAMADYFNYQFPSAICQNCGLSGCTCRNCPATMQNFESGTWGNCCARKHVYAPKPTQTFVTPAAIAAQRHEMPSSNGIRVDAKEEHEHERMRLQQDGNDPSFTEDIRMANGMDPMDLSEFLMNDLERPTQGCCCGDP
ncbi:hypothetical protein LTR37_002507 [Vermiconidia calcicola]|uniref:Uncharacterized protein n=1 Tax=Vermiconidia calcicola TaxID=1690605 RepID=A0ACC3NSW5_9PEZI|nr:hypothetical protein LTR37_002507 [Vermiconidia calcicola]